MRGEHPSLAALIFAYHEADEPGGALRATLPLAGRTLIERQVRIVAAAGAGPIVLFVERLPQALLAAIDRLRGAGINVVAARNAAEAADAVHHDDRLIVVADGLVPDAAHLSRLTAAGSGAILTVPDFGADDRFERVDAESRWAGLALLDGGMLKATAAMLSDWDLQSTLLRRAIQSGARHFSVGSREKLVVAERLADLESIQTRIVEGSDSEREDWVSRYLLAPVENAGTRMLMTSAATPDWIRAGALALGAFSAFFFARGWMLTAMVLLLLATPLPGMAERLARLRMHSGRRDRWWDILLPSVAGAALLGLGWGASQSEGWGCIALAAATLAFVVALRQEQAPGHPAAAALAEWKGMAWIMLPFALTGLWTAGLVLLGLYASGSFFWAQRHAHARFPAQP